MGYDSGGTIRGLEVRLDGTSCVRDNTSLAGGPPAGRTLSRRFFLAAEECRPCA